MEGEEPEPLAYVHETVLKKRKNNDDWAVKRRGILEARKQRKKERLKLAIKRPEEFVRAYRNKELDLVRMKHRLKSRRSAHTDLKSKLIFVTRIHGSKDMHPKTRRVLNLLRLRNVLDGVFMKANEATIKMLISVEPFVTYGYPNLKSIRDLVYKKGCGKIHQNRIPLTDNNVIEQALGEYGIICIEDIVHEISTLGPHFKNYGSQRSRPKNYFELDLVRMKHRLKSRRLAHSDLKSKLIFVTRIHGSKDMHPKTRRILNLLRFGNVLDGVEPFVTCGYPNLKSIRDLVYKKGYGKIHQNRIPLTDNNIIEQALGEYGIIYIEDIVHEISILGLYFTKVTNFLSPFQLKRPERQPPTKKQQFKDGGDTGNHQDCIN